jgi:transposase
MIIEPLFEEKRRPDGRGRPWRDARAVLNGVLWVLRTGAPWHDLPDRYPPYQTCHRRFQQWRKNGVFRDLLTCLAEDLPLRGKIDLTEGFIDARFTAAKKGALSSVLQSAAKATKSWQSSTAAVFPLAVHVACASPHEVRLVDATLEDWFIAPYAPSHSLPRDCAATPLRDLEEASRGVLARSHGCRAVPQINPGTHRLGLPMRPRVPDSAGERKFTVRAGAALYVEVLQFLEPKESGKAGEIGL